MKPFLLSLLLLLCISVSAQKKKDKNKETLSPEETQQIMSQLKIDTMSVLRASAKESCLCIDSIKLRNRGHKEITDDVAACIDKQVMSLQLMIKLMASLSAANKENKITINENRESSEYRTYYFMLEKWLRDSCPSLEAAVASHNKESDKSSTEDAEAMDAYNKGIRAMQNNDLATATLLFTRAVGIDPEFAFAWDNLGICYRRQGKLDEALAAYNKSLELDSNGVTPLHNIPVVYEYQKKYDEAIAAYERLLQKYPDDPEGHYGAGRIFAYYKEDYEKALHELCKAYLIYTATSSPYRVDAEKNINYVYAKMKAQGKEARFYEILKEHGLNPK